MHVADKLDILAGSAQFDLSCACGTSGSRVRGTGGRWIYPAVLPDGRKVRMLKVLMSNACANNCAFCAQRRKNKTQRSAFRPEELARLFAEMHGRNDVMGLFLSSAIDGDVDHSMEQMLRTLELLRSRHGYRGWIHCKILPGASRNQIARAARLATRLSVNLEAASAASLRQIAPQKDFDEDILQRIAWINELIASRRVRCRGQTTQFIVGAGRDTDAGFIHRTEELYSKMGLSRAYYSAFQPVSGTPLQNQPPAPFEREHRLYQADFLLRKYEFSAAELFFDDNGNLPLQDDPKSIWAQRHPEFFPLEVNCASRTDLLRVPGIGPISADRLLRARQTGKLRAAQDISCLGVPLARSGPFLLLDGRRADRTAGSQLRFW
jgi:putative DNA modification/repair radical SAM protein